MRPPSTQIPSAVIDPVLGATHVDKWTSAIEGEELVERRSHHLCSERSRDHARVTAASTCYACALHLHVPCEGHAGERAACRASFPQQCEIGRGVAVRFPPYCP